MKVLKKALLLSTALFLLPGLLFGSALGDLAVTMSAGQWRELSTINTEQALGHTGGASHMTFGYTEDIKWDPGSRGLYYVGSDHFHSPGYPRFVTYSETTNTWTWEDRPNWFPLLEETAMHGYDHNAINQETGDLYHRPFSAKRMIWRYNIPLGLWRVGTLLPNSLVADDSDLGCCIGMEWFPEMNSLVLVNGDNGAIYSFSFTTGKWTEHAIGLSMGSYHNFAEYNPVHHVMIMGGGMGDSHLYKLDANGTVSALSSAPVNLGVHDAMHTVDPVSGDYLIFTRGRQFYVYNVVNDSWQSKSGSIPIWTSVYNNPVHGVVVTPINTYGVNLFVTCNYENCKVNLYQHSRGASAQKREQHNNGTMITVSPNPFDAAVNIQLQISDIKLKKNVEFNIYNIRGTLIKSGIPVSTRMIWDASNYTPGIYILKVKLDTKTFSKKLLLQQ